MGIHRQTPARRGFAAGDEILGLAAPAEAEGLQLHEHLRRKRVVDHRRVHIGGLESGLCIEPPGRTLGLGHARQVLVVVVRDHFHVVGDRLAGADDLHWLLLEIACTLQAGDDDRHAAVAFLAAVEQAQYRLDDPLRVLMVFERDRLFIEPGIRIGRGIGALHHRELAEVAVADTVLLHVALRCQGAPGGWRLRAVGHAPQQRAGAVAGLERRGLRVRLTEAVLGSLVHRTPDQHRFADAGVDRRHRLIERGGGGGATARYACGVRQVLDTEGACQMNLVAAVDREGDHAVDFGRIDPGIIQRRLGAFGCQLQLAAPGLLGKLGLADAGNRGLSETACHALASHRPEHRHLVIAHGVRKAHFDRHAGANVPECHVDQIRHHASTFLKIDRGHDRRRLEPERHRVQRTNPAANAATARQAHDFGVETVALRAHRSRWKAVVATVATALTDEFAAVGRVPEEFRVRCDDRRQTRRLGGRGLRLRRFGIRTHDSLARIVISGGRWPAISGSNLIDSATPAA